MQKPNDVAAKSDITMDGLGHVFQIDNTLIEALDKPDSKVPSSPSKGLTIKQASDHYGLAIPTIRLKIKTGEVPAIKVNGPKGPEWRIFPDGILTACEAVEEFDQPDITPPEEFKKPDLTLLEGFQQANINLGSLIKANQELVAKLEAATYRNGYLESQISERQREIEQHREQIKLLTDSHLKRGWWWRFSSWFLGTKG